MVNPVGNAKTPTEANIGPDANAELSVQQKERMTSLEEDDGKSSPDCSTVVKPISADEQPKVSTAGEIEQGRARHATSPGDSVERSIESKMSSFETIDHQTNGAKAFILAGSDGSLVLVEKDSVILDQNNNGGKEITTIRPSSLGISIDDNVEQSPKNEMKLPAKINQSDTSTAFAAKDIRDLSRNDRFGAEENLLDKSDCSKCAALPITGISTNSDISDSKNTKIAKTSVSESLSESSVAKGIKELSLDNIPASSATQIDDYLPLDGRWNMIWDSHPQNTTVVEVKNHTFEMMGYPCHIVCSKCSDDRYWLSFQWPEVFSLENPIFQEGKSSIPMDLKDSEKPNTIEWTITDKQYGEVTWTRLDSGKIDRKRKAIDEAEVKVRREEEEKRMKSSIPGKAWDLVKAILVLSSQIEDVEAIAEDDMIYLAERLLRAQKCSKECNLPWTVDIAYHHTESINLKTIKTDGLLSLQERKERNIRSKFNGSVHGDGIYCSEDPIRFTTSRRYGDTVVMLARMKGIVSFDKSNCSCDTLLRAGFCVLKCCNQCIPLFHFKSELLGFTDPAQNSVVQDRFERFREKLALFQKLVQGQLDQIVNDDITTQVDIAWATHYNISEGSISSTAAVASSSNPRMTTVQVSKTGPGCLRRLIRPFASGKMVTKKGIREPHANPILTIVAVLSYEAPDNLARTDEKDFCKPCLTDKQLCSNCPTCGDPFRARGKVVQVSNCGHVFHKDCLQKSMESQPCCTVCSLPISQSHWRGKMPSGTMTISKALSHCKGFEAYSTYVIEFVFPAGLQKIYHPDPSMTFSSCGKYTRYLPASPDGTDLLERLKFAFLRGLLFSVGRSRSVVPEVTLKASQEAPCFPDYLFIVKCNAELDRLHVPSAFILGLSRGNASSNNAPVSLGQSNIGSFQANKVVQTSEQTPSSETDTNASTPIQKYANFMNDNSGFLLTWQSNDDLPDRRKIILHIFELLKTMIPEGKDFHQRLPKMAKNLEEHLYRNGQSKEGYMNTNTLKFRLQQMGIGVFAKQKQDRSTHVFASSTPQSSNGLVQTSEQTSSFSTDCCCC